MKVQVIISPPRVYLGLGKLFLDFGWFHSGDKDPLYGITLTFERIAAEGFFTTLCFGLKAKCGMKELAVVGGWSDGE